MYKEICLKIFGLCLVYLGLFMFFVISKPPKPSVRIVTPEEMQLAVDEVTKQGGGLITFHIEGGTTVNGKRLNPRKTK